MEEIWRLACYFFASIVFIFFFWLLYIYHCGETALIRFDKGFTIYCSNGRSTFMVDDSFHLDVDRLFYIRDDHAFSIYDCK